jgi:replicative DNA helicase
MKKHVDITEQKMLPHDTDTENAVLSTLIHYNEKLSFYGDLLNPDIFYYEKEKAIFRCIEGLIKQGSITDINSLFNYSQTHDVGYELFRNDFLEIITCANKSAIEQDILRLRDMWCRRTIWRMLQESSQQILDMTMDGEEEVGHLTKALTDFRNEEVKTEEMDMKSAIQEARQMIQENKDGGRVYLKTGFSLFDDYYLLRPGTMTVIAAFTSVGKTALAMNITEAVARQGIPCAYYSLEMGKVELAARMMSASLGVSANVIMNRRLSEEQMTAFEKTAREYERMPIVFDDRSTVSFERTMRSIRTLVATKHIKLAVIDYLQIYGQVKEDAEESISYMARTIKNVAKETGIPIIALSQLNRSDCHPSIKMLRGSGQIEESADNVVLIDRPEAYPDNKVKKYQGDFSNSPIEGTAKLILAKGRGCGTCSTLVAFKAKSTRFEEGRKADAGHYEEQSEGLPF